MEVVRLNPQRQRQNSTHSNMALAAQQVQFGHCEQKQLSVQPGIEPQSPDLPARSLITTASSAE